jgi:hypothetical protein
MSVYNALSLYDLANRALRSFGACEECVDLYREAAVALGAVGQSTLAGIAYERSAAVRSLL